MKKVLLALIIVLCLGFLIISCPDEKKHKDAITQVTTEFIQQKLNSKAKTDEEKGFALLGGAFAHQMVSILVDSNFYVDNYVLFSVGKLTSEGKTKTVSFGVLGHIFTFDKNDLDNKFEDLKNELQTAEE